jgi:two-component system copper resistance phosphate regulon response regulator CusR
VSDYYAIWELSDRPDTHGHFVAKDKKEACELSVRAGVNIELAPKEFSILEYLLRNKGRALSRTMIVEHVWEMDYTGLTNIVDVYIRHLRGKVDDDWPQKLIKTVRGIGYMIGTAEETEPAAPTSVAG